MNNEQQNPPHFQPKKNKSNNKMIIGGITIALLSGAFGFGGSLLANKISDSNGITINQQSGQANNQQNIHDISDLAAKSGPSVVEITTEATSQNTFFQETYVQGAGSGVIMSEDGYIITNHHVIDGATHVTVRTTDGQEYPAKLIGTDAPSDLAIIKIEAENLVPATFGDSDALEVGDAAIAIGNPLGELGGTVTTGIISALDRQITIDNETMTLLQTDAAINPGNSGGGLFDDDGNLIGIVNAKESQAGIEGLGFAIPINPALDIINELIENGKVTSRPALNLSLYDYEKPNYYTPEDLEPGVYIVQIVQGGAADKAGLQTNDRIVEFDGQKIETSDQVKAILKEHKVGDKVKMVINRDGKNIDVSITLQSSSIQ